MMSNIITVVGRLQYWVKTVVIVQRRLASAEGLD